MRVYVVGAGAVGRYLGDTLAATGAHVAYAPRRLEDIGPVDADLAIVAVKAYDTASAVTTLQRALARSEATILTPQNGVGNEEVLAAAFGADRIVAGALTVPVERGAAGSAATNRGGLALAPVGTAAHNWLIAAFERSSLRVLVASDYRAMKWSKLALNIVANAACAILDVLPGQLVRDRAAFGLDLRAVRETRAVMAAMRLRPIDLPRYPVRALLSAAALPLPLARAVLANRIALARGRKPPSLLLDLQANNARTEVDVLNGAVVTAARSLGISAPVNAAYARVLAALAADSVRWAAYRGRSAALVAEVDAEAQRGS